MRRIAGPLACAILIMAVPLAAQREVISAIQVHGNTITPSEDIIGSAGLTVGTPFSETLLANAERRLRASLKLESVDVLKRYASMTDPSQILIVIQIDEGPVRVDVPDVDVPQTTSARPVVVRRSRMNVMIVPILTGQDGYGFAYGAQFAIAGHRSTRRRVVVPASWGGDKKIAAEYQQEFSLRIAPRLRTGGMVQRRTHPYFHENADRKRVWARTEWSVLHSVQAGTELAWQSTTLTGERDRARSVGADVIVDTRVDPLMPHNAIHARAAVEQLKFARSSAVKTQIDTTGYIGMYRGAVLALRALREDLSRPAPAYFKSILGGSANLRGFRAGHSIGDTLMAGSAELRVPLTSPLRLARFGTSVFLDAGTVYDKGGRFRDQKVKKGFGGGVWATAPLFGISVMVAHGVGATTRVHFTAGLTF